MADTNQRPCGCLVRGPSGGYQEWDRVCETHRDVVNHVANLEAENDRLQRWKKEQIIVAEALDEAMNATGVQLGHDAAHHMRRLHRERDEALFGMAATEHHFLEALQWMHENPVDGFGDHPDYKIRDTASRPGQWKVSATREMERRTILNSNADLIDNAFGGGVNGG